MDEKTVKQVYQDLRTKYPNADVHSSTFDMFYDVASAHTEGGC
jgi:hypothetical protein